jgi:hypothetical protein
MMIWSTMELLVMDLGTEHHFEDEELEAYSLGNMSGQRLARFEEHLLVCGPCQLKVEQADAYVFAMRTAAASVQASPARAPSSWSFWRPALVFAAVLALVVVFAVRRVPNGVEAPVAVGLQALRGPSVSVTAPAGKALLLAPDLTGLRGATAFRLEIVRANGETVWTGQAAGPRFRPQAPALRSGDYYVRIYTLSGELLREFGLTAR